MCAGRRAAVRYEVSLGIVLWPKARLTLAEPCRCITRDVSVQGFYFVSSWPFEVGTRLRFHIFVFREPAARPAELVQGLARCVRMEEFRGTETSSYGIGARIERVVRRQRPKVSAAKPGTSSGRQSARKPRRAGN